MVKHKGASWLLRRMSMKRFKKRWRLPGVWWIIASFCVISRTETLNVLRHELLRPPSIFLYRDDSYAPLRNTCRVATNRKPKASLPKQISWWNKILAKWAADENLSVVRPEVSNVSVRGPGGATVNQPSPPAWAAAASPENSIAHRGFLSHGVTRSQVCNAIDSNILRKRS